MTTTSKICFFSLILGVGLPTLSTAQESPPQTASAIRKTDFTKEEADKINSRVNALSDQLKSPFCPGKTITTCTSPDALKLRVRMQQMMVDGWTDDDIIKQLNEEYGEKLDNPEQPDATVLIYILPLLLVSLATLVVFWSWKKGKKDGLGVADALDATEDGRSEEESAAVREQRLAKLRERIRTDD